MWLIKLFFLNSDMSSYGYLEVFGIRDNENRLYMHILNITLEPLTIYYNDLKSPSGHLEIADKTLTFLVQLIQNRLVLQF